MCEVCVSVCLCEKEVFVTWRSACVVIERAAIAHGERKRLNRATLKRLCRLGLRCVDVQCVCCVCVYVCVCVCVCVLCVVVCKCMCFVSQVFR